MFEQARSSNNVDQSRLYFMLTQLQLQLQGARHVGLDIAGKDVVNPTGILLSSVM
jgi:isocitrate/isopropylmalate dehydrogenase